jgi:hypothetical protein
MKRHLCLRALSTIDDTLWIQRQHRAATFDDQHASAVEMALNCVSSERPLAAITRTKRCGWRFRALRATAHSLRVHRHNVALGNNVSEN